MERGIRQLLRLSLVASLGAAMPLMLAGCSGGDNVNDLDAFVNETKARAARTARVQPLPTIEPYETYLYQSESARDPFERTFAEAEPEDVAAGTGPRPDFNRRKEALETFPLDTLRMVGTLEQDDQIWAIIHAQDGTIHRVTAGNYLGQNHGRIVAIGEFKTDLLEIVPDGLGGWRERQAAIALSE